MWAFFIPVPCALPIGVLAQESERIERDTATVTIDVDGLWAEIPEILDESQIRDASVALVDSNRTIWTGGVGQADVAAGIDVTS